MEPVNYGVIFSYGVQMTLTFAIVLGIYTVRVLVSPTHVTTWYRTNAARIAASVATFWLIAAGLVVVPNIAEILGSFGFNADQSAAGIALAISGYLLSTTPGPAKPEGQ